MGSHIVVVLSKGTARVVAMLAPRTWEQPQDPDGLPATIRFTTTPRGAVAVTLSREYAPTLIAQLEAARDYRAVARVRAAIAG